MARLVGLNGMLGRALGQDSEDLDEIRQNTLVRFVGLGLVTLVVTWWQVPGLLRASRSASWPTAFSTVSDVTRYRQGTKVNLRYAVEGRTFMMEGEDGEPGWQAGTPVKIYYDPADPGTARREAGWGGRDSGALWVLAGLWGATLSLGGVLAYRVRQASRGVLETD